MEVIMRFFMGIFLYNFIVNLVISQKAFEEDGIHSMLDQLANSQDVQSLNYCRISTRDLIATAESTALRVLKGVCNPRELNEKFENLEKQIIDQFNILKTMILNIEDKLRDQDDKIKGQHRKLHRILSGGRNSRNPLMPNGKLRKRFNKENQVTDSPSYDYYDDKNADLDEELNNQAPSPRDAEIQQFNSTITDDSGERVFTYYWTVRDMKYRMKNWGWRRSLRSQSFYIFPYGYRMYMRIYPNQNGKNVYIHVGITKGKYDNVLEWPFKLKHKIQVIDHEDKIGEDLKSRIWDPMELCSGWNWRRPDSSVDNYECVGLGFPQETLESRNYLYRDSMTTKLTVYLDSNKIT